MCYVNEREVSPSPKSWGFQHEKAKVDREFRTLSAINRIPLKVNVVGL